MKNQLINTLVGFGIILTFIACTKDEDIQTGSYPTLQSSNTQTPADTGEFARENGDTLYLFVNANYLLTTPIDLGKYQNGAILDSVCNSEISIVFNSKGKKIDNSSNRWGLKPEVVDEFAAKITFKASSVLSMKLSKKVYEFGFEYNTINKGKPYSVHSIYSDKKSPNYITEGFYTYLELETSKPFEFGDPGGAMLWAIRSPIPFDQVDMVIGNDQGRAVPGTFEYSISGFRYKLVK